MSSDPLTNTEIEIRAALKRVASATADLTAATPTDVRHALAYLHAVIPFDHDARLALLQLVDMHQHWTRYPDEVQAGLVQERVDAVLAAIDAEPVDVPELRDAAELRALSDKIGTDWHESDVTAALTGGRYVDNAGSGYLYPSVVLYQEGRPVAQINLAVLLGLAEQSN